MIELNMISSNSSENKHKEGDIVFAKVNPSLKLVVRRYVDRIYYCKIQKNPTLKELVYFERELKAISIEPTQVNPASGDTDAKKISG